MVETLTLKNGGKGAWGLTGELNLTVLSQQYHELFAQFPKKGPWQIDCANLSRVDTSGVAFLLACIRHANTHAIRLQIISTHKQLIQLMRVQGVMEIISPYLEGHS